jgi:hypothetical protein
MDNLPSALITNYSNEAGFDASGYNTGREARLCITLCVLAPEGGGGGGFAGPNFGCFWFLGVFLGPKQKTGPIY